VAQHHGSRALAVAADDGVQQLVVLAVLLLQLLLGSDDLEPEPTVAVGLVPQALQQVARLLGSE
jgi:hypothetical protein